MSIDKLTSISLEIQNKVTEFNANNEKALKGNKSAGTRARKNSMELRYLLKEYKALSIEVLK